MKQHSRTRTVMILIFLIIMWGVNWPLSKLALNYTPPLLFTGIRTFLGGLILFFIAIPKFKLLKFKKTWHLYIISAFLNIILFYGLQTVGLNTMPAGPFSTIVYIEPVLLGIFSWIWLGEEMYVLKIIGLILGFTGVAVISTNGFTCEISSLGITLALLSAISWGLGTVFVKKIGEKVELIWMVTLQLIFGGIFLMCVGSWVESWSNIEWSIPFVINLIFISIFIIALGWLVYFKLVASGEASKIGSYTFLIPLIAILSSSIILHEPITLNLLIGLLLIIISICFVNIKLGSQRVKEKVEQNRNVQ